MRQSIQLDTTDLATVITARILTLSRQKYDSILFLFLYYSPFIVELVSAYLPGRVINFLIMSTTNSLYLKMLSPVVLMHLLYSTNTKRKIKTADVQPSVRFTSEFSLRISENFCNWSLY